MCLNRNDPEYCNEIGLGYNEKEGTCINPRPNVLDCEEKDCCTSKSCKCFGVWDGEKCLKRPKGDNDCLPGQEMYMDDCWSMLPKGEHHEL